MASGAAALAPTYEGHISSTQDALMLFEACLTGHLHHVPRRPHDRERASLIRSGCVFIYEENASGIKRWTDGVTWSPSRILGNFLIYRELDKPFPPGEKKRAMKKQNRRPIRPEPYSTSRTDQNGDAYSPKSTSGPNVGQDRSNADQERALVGSLVDSYGFKDQGLVKKTMSVTVQGVTHHLVSYYSCDDVVQNKLMTPKNDMNLQRIQPRHELIHKQSFRVAVEEASDDLMDARDPSGPYVYSSNIMTTQGYLQTPARGYFQVPASTYITLPQTASSHTAPYPMAMSAPPQSYMPSATTNSQYIKNEDYSSYNQPTYRGNYNGVGGQTPITTVTSNMPPILQTSLPPSQPERTSTHSLFYGQPNIQQRPGMSPSPVTLDRSSSGFAINTANHATSLEPRRSHQPSPAQMTDRRDSQLPYSSERQPQFYTDGGSGSMGDYTRPQYQQNAPLQSWPQTL